MLAILLFIPGDYAGPCFIGFAIGESLGASALRIAGGIFTKIADIGSDLMKIVFNIKEDDARNPGVIADCTGDNAGDSVGPRPTASRPTASPASRSSRSSSSRSDRTRRVQVQLLVWIFAMRIVMVIASRRLATSSTRSIAKAQVRQRRQDELRAPAHASSCGSPRSSRSSSPSSSRTSHRRTTRRRHGLWWKLSAIIIVRHARRRDHPRARQGLHLDRLRPRARGRHRVAEGGASLNILVGPHRR